MAEILIVDDSITMRRQLALALSRAGFTVHAADGGPQALRLATAHAIDVVITDVNMPGMNGLELSAALRARPDTRRTPILVLTTEANPQLKAIGKSVGVNGWIVKPFNPPTLIRVLKKMTRT